MRWAPQCSGLIIFVKSKKVKVILFDVANQLVSETTALQIKHFSSQYTFHQRAP